MYEDYLKTIDFLESRYGNEHKNLKNTLSYKQSGDGVFISTHPLDNGEWKPFPMAQVIAFRAGKEVYRGKPHKGIFVPTLEYITAMDAMNI